MYMLNLLMFFVGYDMISVYMLICAVGMFLCQQNMMAVRTCRILLSQEMIINLIILPQILQKN